MAAGQSSYFVWLNRAKTSVTLDLMSERGKAELETLIADADVLIQNLKTGSLARLGFDPERLRAHHPKLIVCSISVFGEFGPMSQRKAYDLLIQAETGLCSITGGPTEPSRVWVFRSSMSPAVPPLMPQSSRRKSAGARLGRGPKYRCRCLMLWPSGLPCH